MGARSGRGPRGALLASAIALMLGACATPAPDPRPSPDPRWTVPGGLPGRFPMPRRHAPPSSERPPWYTDPPANPERIRLRDDGQSMTLAGAMRGGAA